MPDRTMEDSNYKSALTARIVSGSIGSILTSLIVTPLEVVKVRTQNEPAAAVSSTRTTTTITTPPNSRVVPCPRGCGTFVLFNGQMECTLPKSYVPYFDHVTGKLVPAPCPPQPLQQPHTTLSRRVGAVEPSRRASVGTFAMMRRIFAKEGFPGIYAGLRPTLVMAVPNTVLYFSAYEEIVWRLRTSADEERQWLHPLLAGASARLVSSSVTAPFEFLRTRQAAATGEGGAKTAGMWQEFRSIVQNEGASTLYRGLRPTLWRDVPFSAIYWLSIEQCRIMWSSRTITHPLSPLEQAGQAFLNGALSGMIAAACTTPFDVIKTRQQAAVSTAPAVEIANGACASQLNVGLAACKHDGAIVYEGPVPPSKHQRHTGTFQLLREIAQSEGRAGLWRGNQARMLKVAPGCAIMISSYEFGKRILES